MALMIGDEVSAPGSAHRPGSHSRMVEGGPGAGTALLPATAPPVRGSPEPYLGAIVQSVNPSSPNTNRAHSPLIETSRKLSSNVSPTETVNTSPSTST